MTWEKCFGGTSEERLRHTQFGRSNVIRTFDNKFVIAGNSVSTNGDITDSNGGRDCWIVKFDGDGNLVWQKSYGGSDQDQANKVIETSDHGYLVIGSTNSVDGDVTNNKGGDDVWVLKLDVAGNLQWQKTYGGSGTDIGGSACQDGNSYVITGATSSNNIDVSGNHSVAFYDVWTFKIDLNGNMLWENV
ncbi:hypothetical protein [Flavobacterium humi]|uniref:T9SS C-terminal target domain-containing protein n=1 Tax=Flavobacterium humi TaxID=2562683 RepID=A0A4Z0L7F2_9FLAO|nr:hypothetical protein [Flavobacterium humi]TGD56922.1 hypothetical protein E4635_14095 [Flavobacterium humi]